MLARTIVVIGFLLVLVSCTRSEGIGRLPVAVRAEARAFMPMRKKECDVLQASIAPSKDDSGGISVLGVGISFRSARLATSGARDQYLIALYDVLSACRRWQRFESGSAQGYREAQLRAADIAQGALGGAAVTGALDRLAEALANARAVSEGGEATQAEVAKLRDDLSRPPGMLDGPSIGARFDRLEGLVAAISVKGNSPQISEGTRSTWREWRVRFATGSSQPDVAQLSEVRSTMPPWTAKCERSNITIVGYTDGSGHSAKNLRLAKARADTVRMELAKLMDLDLLSSAAGETMRFGNELSANRLVVVRAECEQIR